MKHFISRQHALLWGTICPMCDGLSLVNSFYIFLFCLCPVPITNKIMGTQVGQSLALSNTDIVLWAHYCDKIILRKEN